MLLASNMPPAGQIEIEAHGSALPGVVVLVVFQGRSLGRGRKRRGTGAAKLRPPALHHQGAAGVGARLGVLLRILAAVEGLPGRQNVAVAVLGADDNERRAGGLAPEVLPEHDPRRFADGDVVQGVEVGVPTGGEGLASVEDDQPARCQGTVHGVRVGPVTRAVGKGEEGVVGHGDSGGAKDSQVTVAACTRKAPRISPGGFGQGRGEATRPGGLRPNPPCGPST